jgi:exoribonuclease-2
MRRRADPEHYVDLSLAVMKLLGAGEYKVETPGGQQNGHFGLAVNDYSHSTAPNRRYPDLVTQRLLKAVISGACCPYGISALTEIAERSTRMESLAKRVERAVRKAAVAQLLSSKVGAIYRAIVTGVNDRGTFVRVIDPPVEGRVVEGEAGFDVGDEITVRLLSTDAARGFIDFAAIGQVSAI